MYGAPTLPQPEYAMPAPMTADYRPIETARLIPSLASQSLVVLQNRKQEILDQLEKIGTASQQQQQQMYSIWNSQVRITLRQMLYTFTIHYLFISFYYC